MKKDIQKAVDHVMPGLFRFFYRAFTRINITLPDFDLTSLKDSMLMVVSTHRSQTDDFLLGTMIYKYHIRYIRIAAGDNLTSLPVLGKKFESYGAFSVKRDTGFKRNYIRDLCFQVVSMMENGEPILLFPEGGRSYGGNMMEVKGGVLLSAILAQARHPDKKVYVLPASVSYEYLPELPFFPMLDKGKELRKKGKNFFSKLLGNMYYFGADILAFGSMILATKFVVRKGDVFVNIGKPMLVTDMVDIKANYQENARDEVSGHQQSMRILSGKVQEQFHALYQLLPQHVLAGILAQKQTVPLSEAIQAIPAIIKTCSDQKQNVSYFANMTTEKILAKAVEELRHFKAIRVQGDTIQVLKPKMVTYYAAALTV